MLKIRRPLGRLIFNMGIAIPGKTVFLIETAPSSGMVQCLVTLVTQCRSQLCTAKVCNKMSNIGISVLRAIPTWNVRKRDYYNWMCFFFHSKHNCIGPEKGVKQLAVLVLYPCELLQLEKVNGWVSIGMETIKLGPRSRLHTSPLRHLSFKCISLDADVASFVALAGATR